jgi:hypothetical protein
VVPALVLPAVVVLSITDVTNLRGCDSDRDSDDSDTCDCCESVTVLVLVLLHVVPVT